MVCIRGREYDQQITQRHFFDRAECGAGEAFGLLTSDREKVSGLFSGELCSDKMPRWEDQNVQTKRVGFITP